MSPPLISVLLPVHNGMPYLPETMAGLLGQTFRDFEVVFVDDASTDDTPAYVRSLADPRVRYVRVEQGDVTPVPGMGTYYRLVHALNVALAHATGTLAARLDGDDVCRPDRLAVQAEAFRADSALVLLGCDFDVIDATGRPTGENPYNVTSDPAARWVLLFDSPFLHPGVMFPLAAARRVGGYRNWACCEDYDLYARLAPLGRFGLTGRKLMSKRMHGGNASVVYRNQGFATTARLVAEYARANYTPDLPAAEVIALYAFYHDLPDQPPADPLAVRRTFAALEAGFRDRHDGLPADAERAVGFVREYLAWRCYHTVRSVVTRPGELVRWLRAAARLDPSRYAPARLAGRSLGLVRPRPIDRRVTPEPIPA
jgi:glycosyltransferase involved in cell wall biosynthesis